MYVITKSNNVNRQRCRLLFKCSYFIFLLFSPFCLDVALAVEERARQLQMRVHSHRPGSSASSGHDPEAELKNRRDVSVKLLFRSLTHVSGSTVIARFLIPIKDFLSCLWWFRCIRIRGGVVITCLRGHQTVTWAMHQLSLEPAVPHGWAPPATCPFSLRDHTGESG